MLEVAPQNISADPRSSESADDSHCGRAIEDKNGTCVSILK